MEALVAGCGLFDANLVDYLWILAHMGWAPLDHHHSILSLRSFNVLLQDENSHFCDSHVDSFVIGNSGPDCIGQFRSISHF